MNILSAHITHKWVDIQKLELFSSKEAKSLLHTFYSLPSVKECIILKTCNRVEIYMATESLEKAKNEFNEITRGFVHSGLAENIKFLENINSLHHLMKVSSGLDSMIVGEDQILGQIKQAYEFAKNEKTIGKTLSTAFRKAINVGKKVREHTRINKGNVSVGSSSVELAEKLLGSLNGKTVLVIGAGEMATLVVKALAVKNLKTILVVSRTYEHAINLANELKGEAFGWDKLEECLKRADVIISAASAPHIIISKNNLKDINRKLFIIDIANPRNVSEDVKELSNIELHNIDGLKSIADENLQKRRDEVEKVEKIINEELKLLIGKYEEGNAEEIIREIYNKVNMIKEQEYKIALNKLNSIDEKQKEVIYDLVNSLSNKILATPTLSLKKASKMNDKELLKSAIKLFNLELEEKG